MKTILLFVLLAINIFCMVASLDVLMASSAPPYTFSTLRLAWYQYSSFFICYGLGFTASTSCAFYLVWRDYRATLQTR